MREKTKISLLAPARDLRVGMAAIDAGADAVYVGAPEFSARQAAGCSTEDIEKLCRYAHLFGCKVLVALNTLLTDEERKKAVKIAWEVYEAGADALIIQDLRLLQESLPPIRLHASTQCDNRTTEDVLARERQGFSRAVLARELTIDEIREIRRNTNIELEAFVHGALCVSYSGRCYMSEKVLGRSANRGCCAQLCRWQYDLLDKDGNELARQKYVLSLRDMDRSRYLREMLDAGITTLKIEGRLKDEAYVRNITAYYRGLLDEIFEEEDSAYCRASEGKIYLDFTPNTEKTFHRSATEYFLHGRTEKMANWETPKSTGEAIGRVRARGRNWLELETEKELHNGDGLCFGDKGFMVNRVEGKRVYPNQMPDTGVGESLYRNLDTEFIRRLEQSRTRRKVITDIVLEETERGFRLRIGEAAKEFEAEKTKAENGERARANTEASLRKLGDTVFEAGEVRIDTTEAYFIPTSVINAWRREVVEMLTRMREKRQPRTEVHRGNGGESQEIEKTEGGKKALMTCRYCILNEMGICRKKRGRREVAEPKYIRSGKHRFELVFDCKKCEMRVVEA